MITRDSAVAFDLLHINLMKGRDESTNCVSAESSNGFALLMTSRAV